MLYDTILFDLGGTLIDYRGSVSDWPSMERIGMAAVHTLLNGNGHKPPTLEAFQETCFANLKDAWYAAVRGERNLVLSDLLQESLASHGVHCDHTLLEQAVQGYTTAISAGARPQDGARELLQALSTSGRRLGLISNTMWPPAAHIADLRRFELYPFFEELVFSAERGVWKPDPQVFDLAMRAVKGRPERTVYVGDNPHDDILGARRAGIRSIWIRTDEYPPDAGREADAIVDHLLEIPEVLARWEAES